MFDHLTSRVFLSRAQQRLFRSGVPVFVLHKVAEPPRATRDPFDYVRPQALENRLTALLRLGFRSLSLDELIQASVVQDRAFVVTFDDGYRNVLRNALEVLQRCNVHAIQFLVAGRLGMHNDWDVKLGEVREDLMSEAEVREWLAAGHSIGSHGYTHRILNKLSPAEAKEELSASRKKLEDTFGVPVGHFCYPSGRYTPQVREMVQEAGYASACTVEFGVNPPAAPPFELRRIGVLTFPELLAKVVHRARRKLRTAG